MDFILIIIAFLMSALLLIFLLYAIFSMSLSALEKFRELKDYWDMYFSRDN